MLLLFPLAFADGLSTKDGELTEPHLDLTLSATQLSALAQVGDDACPLDELTLEPAQRAALAAKTGVEVTWVRARPQRCWTDCLCGEANIGLVNGAHLSVQIDPLSAWRLSGATQRRFSRALLLDPSNRRLAGTGEEVEPTPYEIARADALTAAAPRVVDPRGRIVTDGTLGAYRTFAVSLPAGASVARIRHPSADLEPLAEGTAGLPFRRSELQIGAGHAATTVQWPDSAIAGDTVVLATVCSHEIDGEFPCFVAMTYEGDHLRSAVQVEPTGAESVTEATWEGETLTGVTARLWGALWIRWGGLR